MTARYIVRLDDACHSMSREKWGAVEEALDRLSIKPVVAVVPDNHDKALCCDEMDSEFWDKVRRWKNKGWVIAMHGYQHLMHETNSKLILPFYQHSEFAGLPYDEQAEKIRLSWEMFIAEDIHPDVWIAPAHCFDWTTLDAIRAETSIRIVSDGIARNQYYEAGFYWIPQQLWEFCEKKNGLWTVCLHPNSMSLGQINTLFSEVRDKYSDRVISLNSLKLHDRKKTIYDLVYSMKFWGRHRAIKILNKIRSI